MRGRAHIGNARRRNQGLRPLPICSAAARGGSVADTYADALRRMRKEKDDWFKRSPHSPVPEEERAAFTGLRYFEPDESFRVEASWLPNAAPPVVRMQTSTGEERDYLVAGKLAFRVGERDLTLEGYRAALGESHELFIPFRDETAGKDTYGAGRYLEVDEPRDGRAVIDFNLAYNPYCAYSEAYSCPFPPPANWLKARIEAGEKTFHP